MHNPYFHNKVKQDENKTEKKNQFIFNILKWDDSSIDEVNDREFPHKLQEAGINIQNYKQAMNPPPQPNPNYHPQMTK